MKNINVEKIILYLAIVPLTIISFIFYINYSRKVKIKNERINLLTDSISYINGVNGYYSGLLKIKMKLSNITLDDNSIKVYDITADTNKSNPVKISSILGKNNHSLILRYTQIGCNECSSLTVKKLKTLRKLHPDLAIYAFVDFTNYDSYLQWRKVGEIDFPVFYVKKQNFPFDKDCNEYSYVFLVNKDGVASDFFVPNSGHPDMLDYFFDNIYKKGI
jgi:hypothetical protein